MSGHSKWAKIKHAKGAADAKKGKVFSRMAQQITLAVKEGGGEIDSNPSLRLLVDKAKTEGLPAANIERAINRGMGVGKDGAQFVECVYEGMGPAGVSFILDVTTDNRNRVVSDLRKIFSTSGGNLSEGGSLLWNFEQKGRVEVRCGKMEKNEKYGHEDDFIEEDKDAVMMNLMDVENVQDIEEFLEDGEVLLHVFTDVKDLNTVKKEIDSLGYIVNTYGLIRVSKMQKDIADRDKEKIVDFVEKLEDYSDVQGVWHDAKL